MKSNDELILFWRSKSSFSNWNLRYPFTHNGIIFNCSEQYMMYQKAVLFNDTITAKRILNASHPYDQKKLGREVRDYVEEIWAEERVQIMVEGLLCKFSQNEEAKKELLSTGNKIIAESSPIDPIWGIGLSTDNPDAWDTSKWKGRNLLGIVLMKVRDILREENVDQH